jgi:hypothetical protein
LGELVRQELKDAGAEGSWVTEWKDVNVGKTPVRVGVDLGEAEGVEEAFTLPLAPTPVSLALEERDTVGVKKATVGDSPDTLAALDPVAPPPVLLGCTLTLRPSELLPRYVWLWPKEAVEVGEGTGDTLPAANVTVEDREEQAVGVAKRVPEEVDDTEREGEGAKVTVPPPERDGLGDAEGGEEAVPVEEGVKLAKIGVGVIPTDTLAPNVLIPVLVPILEADGGEDKVDVGKEVFDAPGEVEPVDVPLTSSEVGDDVALPPPPPASPPLLVALGVPDDPTL